MTVPLTNFLADAFDLESFLFSKPKKYKNSEVMVCKIKNKMNEPVLVQFPKMLLKNDFTEKYISLEFIKETGYTKKVHTFLDKLNDFIIEYVSTNSEKWFGKNIPMEKVKMMYKTDTEPENIKFVFDKSKSELIDKKNEEIGSELLVKGVTLECISQLKYLVFTKDTCFVNWEICTAKLHKKVVKVQNFGFVEDPDDESDSDEEETFTFF